MEERKRKDPMWVEHLLNMKTNITENTQEKHFIQKGTKITGNELRV
jgi:hypothetical protein